jgi:hypothetical protein
VPTLAVIAGQTANTLRPARPDQMIQRILFGGKPARQSVKIHHQPLLAPIIYPKITCVKGIIILFEQYHDRHGIEVVTEEE